VKLPNLPKPRSRLDLALWSGTAVGVVAIFLPFQPIRAAPLAVGLGSASAIAIRHRQRQQQTIDAIVRDAESNARDRIETALDKQRHAESKLAEALEILEVLRPVAIAGKSAESELREWRDIAVEIQDRERQLKLAQDQFDIDRQRVSLELQQQLTAARDELTAANERIAALTTNTQKAIQSAIADTQTPLQLEIARLKTRIAELATARDLEKQRLDLERSLPTLPEVIGSDRRPALICGGQGAGKGTSTVAMVAHYAGDAGAIAIALDVSEGGLDASTWSLAGIPSTSEPREMLEFCERLERELSNGRRYHRTQPEFATQSAIIPIFDELTTMFNGLCGKEIERFLFCITAFRTRGSKFGVYPIFCTQSEQIQNLKCNKVQLLNSGNIGSFWRLWLNDILVEFAAKFPASIANTTQQYLDAHQGHYVAALLTVEGGAKVLRPIKHPSHHGQVLDNKEPTVPIRSPVLAPPPNWLPDCLRAIYQRFSGEMPIVEHQTAWEGFELSLSVAVREGIEAIAAALDGRTEWLSAAQIRKLRRPIERLSTDELAAALDALTTCQIVERNDAGKTPKYRLKPARDQP